MEEQVITYIKEHRERLLDDMKKFLSIPSISTDQTYDIHMKEAASFVEDYLTDIGFTTVERMETGGHPLVYASYDGAGEDAPTVLFYGHYDVQPVDPLELWDTNPFDPTVREDRLYARGASDDKGQVFMHLAVFEAYMKVTGGLPVNMKVCIEGEEEVGSPNLYPLLKEHSDRFDADLTVISDSGMVENDQPTILYGVKGLTGLEINVKGPNRDLHSGIYGGSVRNPIQALTHILTTMKDSNEVVTVKGFYDDVEPLAEEERAQIKNLPSEDFPATTGVKETVSEEGYTAAEHTMGRPTLEINGIYGGYQGEGTKTIIPSEATAKITCRLVPGQDPDHIQNLLEEHILAHAPTGVDVHVKKEAQSAKAYKVEPEHPYIQKAAKSYEKGFGKETVFIRMGGSLPIVEWLDDIYQKPIVLMGFGTPEDRLHAPNESFPLNSFDKGIETLIYYWQEISL